MSAYGSGEGALASLPREAPEILLVGMDIKLSGMDGIECVRRLRPLMPKTQFLVLMVYADTDHIFSALAAGASGYLLKETGCEELIAWLKLVHAGGAAMTSQIARKLAQSVPQPRLENLEPQGLSPREQAILKLLSRGDYYREIADNLDISINTVATHIQRIYEKLHVRSRAHAIAKYAIPAQTRNHRPAGQVEGVINCA